MPTRLLLIEDHHALRKGLELLLSNRGCEVVGTGGSAAEALALVVEREPDVAVVDVHLGVESGITLTRELLDVAPGCRVVLYTGAADAELMMAGLEAGAMGYALKDGDPDELMTAIRAAVAGSTYVDPRLRDAVPPVRATTTPAPDRTSRLSKREREIMDHLAQGLTGEQVAERLVVSPETVKTHIRNAMNKLEASTRVHAVALALRDGQISPPV